jgi:hypothetical protein
VGLFKSFCLESIGVLTRSLNYHTLQDAFHLFSEQRQMIVLFYDNNLGNATEKNIKGASG